MMISELYEWSNRNLVFRHAVLLSRRIPTRYWFQFETEPLPDVVAGAFRVSDQYAGVARAARRSPVSMLFKVHAPIRRG